MKIPIPVIAVVADVLGLTYSHARIDHFMRQAGIEGDPPPGNKIEKARAWLRRLNEDSVPDPLAVLGQVLVELMEVNTVGYAVEADLSAERAKVERALADHGLVYARGGRVHTAAGAVSRGLEDIIRSRDLRGLQAEFDRISQNIEPDPAAAVTASCALLESLFKIYIADEHLGMPSDQTIKPLWNVVRKDLKFDPGSMQDEDLRKILSGLASIVDGIGALRTHKSSAHGHGHTLYKLKPRHARLAAQAAFTLATFVLETWHERQVAHPIAHLATF